MEMLQKPIIGISSGDPSGIGPEIVVKALAFKRIYDICRPIVISDYKVMQDAVRIAGLEIELNRIQMPGKSFKISRSWLIESASFSFGQIDVLDMDNVDIKRHRYKVISAESGIAAFQYIAKLIEIAMTGAVDATVTGPISKEAINLAGLRYSGHTEIYSELTGAKDPVMMLVDGNFRIAHVSGHVSLRKACDLVKKDRILRVINLVNDALMNLGIEKPKIAVSGLNPHASENGLFGDEEENEIKPAIEEAVKLGVSASGPFPPDTIFSRARGGEFDAVIAMYHDQGHIALKTSSFVYAGNGKWTSIPGVNVTLGLPIIRTSVDHGVALDKAGEGIANPQSMIQAIELAVRLCSTKKERHDERSHSPGYTCNSPHNDHPVNLSDHIKCDPNQR